jgi:multimeric flavodoxin WrbA
MKAIAIVGSPRKNGNTEILAEHALKAIHEEGLETELVRLCELEIKAVMDRAGYIAIHNGRPFEGKVGGPLAVGGREGQNFTIAQMAYWFYYLGFIIPGSTSWNIAFGSEKGDVLKDSKGLETAWRFSKNIASLVMKLKT